MALAGLVLCLVWMAGGCATRPVAVLASTQPLRADAEITKLGPSDARATSVFLLCIPLSGFNPTKTALREAIKKKGADALISVTVDSQVLGFPYTILPLFSVVTVYVHGEAVKLSE